MTHSTHINTSAAPFSGFGGRISAMIETLRASRARRATYRTTVAELSQLSDRDLADLGLSRSNIRNVAFEAAYGK